METLHQEMDALQLVTWKLLIFVQVEGLQDLQIHALNV